MVRFLPLFLVCFFLIAVFAFKEQLRPRPVNELATDAFVQKALSGNGQFDPTADKAIWFNREVPLPGAELAQVLAENPTVLGETNEEKWIEVDLTTQKLYAHEGNRTVFEFPVSSGLPWMPTVTGEFRIWSKVRAQRMTGGEIANGTFYDLPNVPFVQYFYKAYSLHGAYWHNDFGKPRSHGCVNLRIADAEKLYYWTNPILNSNEYARYRIKPQESTRIIVHGTTPRTIN